VRIAVHVPPGAFIPRPKVGSAVVVLKPHSVPPDVADKKILLHMIRAAFNQRRKTLANALSAYAPYPFNKTAVLEALERLGLRADIRGEALALSQFAALCRAL
jgi:16S rRNA (adenine1518-N6/adenine1519-N6)-dimethyltransferase